MLSLIPWPTVVDGQDAAPLALDVVHLVAPDDALAVVAAEQLAAAGVRVADEDGATPVVLRLDTAAGPEGSDNPERYTLRVTTAGVEATAPETVGLLHAVRTLRQLVPVAEASGAREVPAVVVHDAPRYRWRGLSFDVVRHWFGPEDIRAVVDLVGAFKLRVLHLHLTDDQGWRIETPSRPELEKASDSQVGGGTAGFLTVDDFRDLQEYAAARFVTIVPEFDMPGHINAATQVYGALTKDGLPTEPYDGIEVGFSRLWFDNPATEPFLRDVIGDVAGMTQGDWVHVGGDEVHTMEVEEFAKFVELAARIVREHGKTPIFWQEGARGPVEPGTLLQYWEFRDKDLGPFLEAARRGARFIFSPGNRAYLDMKYTPEHPIGQSWLGAVHVELHDSYDWDPAAVIEGLSEDAVEGVEAAVWTEAITTRDELFSMLLPRLGAVAEVAWTAPERKDWDAFRARTAAQAPAWRAAGWAFHETPQVDW